MDSSGATALKPFLPLKRVDFFVGATLGTGSFSHVRLVTHRAADASFALKMLSKVDVYKFKQVEHVLNERQILERLNHPTCVKLVGTFQDERYLYLVLNFVVGGELYR